MAIKVKGLARPVNSIFPANPQDGIETKEATLSCLPYSGLWYMKQILCRCSQGQITKGIYNVFVLRYHSIQPLIYAARPYQITVY